MTCGSRSIELALSPDADVRFRWVKGHSGDRWNDRVDELATVAADSGQRRERLSRARPPDRAGGANGRLPG